MPSLDHPVVRVKDHLHHNRAKYAKVAAGTTAAAMFVTCSVLSWKDVLTNTDGFNS